jgi:hypothetical protein
MVPLTGLGDNAHAYDPFAFQFTGEFHVIVITPREYQPSQWYADTIRAFGVAQAVPPEPVVYTLPNASHYFSLNEQAFVVLAMRRFLLGSPVDGSRAGQP